MNAPSPPVKLHALLVGNNAGMSSSDPLRGAETDANRVAAFLKGSLKYNTAEVLLADIDSKTCVLTEIKKLVEKCGTDDLVIFYYSGHGYEENNDLVMNCWEASRDKKAHPDGFDNLRLSSIKQLECECNLLIITDACRTLLPSPEKTTDKGRTPLVENSPTFTAESVNPSAGSTAKGSATQARDLSASDVRRRNGLVAIYACTVGNPTYEVAQGCFTQALLKHLELMMGRGQSLIISSSINTDIKKVGAQLFEDTKILIPEPKLDFERDLTVTLDGKRLGDRSSHHISLRHIATPPVPELHIRLGHVEPLYLVCLPKQHFVMGCPPEYRHSFPDALKESLQTVDLCWFSPTLISGEQWYRVMEPNSTQNSTREPKTSITYVEADEFCKRITALAKKNKDIADNMQFNLPTERQWECAYKQEHAMRGRVEYMAPQPGRWRATPLWEWCRVEALDSSCLLPEARLEESPHSGSVPQLLRSSPPAGDDRAAWARRCQHPADRLPVQIGFRVVLEYTDAGTASSKVE